MLPKAPPPDLGSGLGLRFGSGLGLRRGGVGVDGVDGGEVGVLHLKPGRGHVLAAGDALRIEAGLERLVVVLRGVLLLEVVHAVGRGVALDVGEAVLGVAVVFHAVGSDHEDIALAVGARLLDVVAVLVPVEGLEAVPEGAAARELEDLLAHGRHGHVLLAAHAPVVPVPEQHDDVRAALGAHEGAGLLEVRLHLLPRRAAGVADEADVPELVVPEEVLRVVLHDVPVLLGVRVHGEVQEALRDRVLRVPLHRADAPLVKLAAAVRHAAHPEVVVAGHRVEQLALHLEAQAVEELLAEAAILA
mmetsp:Transcript_9318/g.27380  ORF Transcript_9318/g.27380 Transcript_9318/m.27380 type:complete len:303 (-) Transcript_9318:942-1850(-)